MNMSEAVIQLQEGAEVSQVVNSLLESKVDAWFSLRASKGTYRGLKAEVGKYSKIMGGSTEIKVMDGSKDILSLNVAEKLAPVKGSAASLVVRTSEGSYSDVKAEVGEYNEFEEGTAIKVMDGSKELLVLTIDEDLGESLIEGTVDEVHSLITNDKVSSLLKKVKSARDQSSRDRLLKPVAMRLGMTPSELDKVVDLSAVALTKDPADKVAQKFIKMMKAYSSQVGSSK